MKPDKSPLFLPRMAGVAGLLGLAVLTGNGAPAVDDAPPAGGEAAGGLSQRPVIEPGVAEAIEGDAVARVIIVLRGSRAVPPAAPPAVERAFLDDVAAAHRAFEAALPGRGVRLLRQWDYAFGAAAEIDVDGLEALSRMPLVERLYLDGVVHAHLAQGVPLIKANVLHLSGFTGAGTTIAVIDTGIDYTHAALGGCLGSTCKVLAGIDFVNNDSDPMDDNGHGTSVAGIAAANSPTLRGVAYNAKLVGLKVLSATGSGSFSDVDSALNWVLLNRATYGIKAANMSLGDGGQYNSSSSGFCATSTTANLIQSLVNLGVAVTVSSGNDGYDAGVSFPACVGPATAVGGVYDASLGGISWCGTTCATILCTDNPTFADKFVCHTNAGAPLDVLTPDWRTTTAAAGGGTRDFGGTSAAAPYAAGAFALLFNVAPSAGVATIEANFKSTGVPVLNPDNGQSYPRIDVEAAARDFDLDLDGHADALDNCPGAYNPSQADGDGDGFGDACDNCPSLSNASQANADGDPAGDPCDCDPARPAVYPGAPEVCDGFNNDCDHPQWPSLSVETDDDSDGLAECGGDCDDADASRRPGLAESCDGVDNDCNGVVPQNEMDFDGDGFKICQGDCNDSSVLQHPGLPEVCDGLDNDCAGGLPASEQDTDLDGYRPCTGDCNDSQATVHPGAPEICDGFDSDCDDVLPPGEADADADAWAICEGDCDDTRAAVHPGAPEVCDGVNNDCNHPQWPSLAVESDDDADGEAECGGDCDDADPSRRAGFAEACDGVDNDCAGGVPADESDADADGFRICAGDCNDASALQRPGLPEVCDGLDNDCAGGLSPLEHDDDQDGYRICAGDCDDTRDLVHPGAAEVCDGHDTDCSGSSLPGETDADADAWLVCEGDCDDADGGVYPGSPEVCDGRNNDCGHPAWPSLSVETDDDGDGVAECAGDCDDAEVRVRPGLPDLCDEMDNDCDGATDPGYGYFLDVPAPSLGSDPIADQGTRLGTSVLGLPDVTGDGVPDVVSGAVGWPAGSDSKGAVVLFSGADRSLVRRMTDSGGSVAAYLGATVATPGDADFDGKPDVAAGAYGQDVSQGRTGQGRVLMFSGASGAVLWSYQDSTVTDQGALGFSLAGTGDVDGDGVGEVAAGAPSDCRLGLACSGSVAVLSGRTGQRLRYLTDPANGTSERFGSSLAAVGDMDGDGTEDLAVGAPLRDQGSNPDVGAVLVFSGATGALIRTYTDPSPTGADALGTSLAALEDLDGDGKMEIAAGAPGRSAGTISSAGAVVVFSGGTGALLRRLTDPAPASFDRLGDAVAALGDVDRDGREDVLAGAPSRDAPPNADAGSVLLFNAATGAFLKRLAHPQPAAADRFGTSVGVLASPAGNGYPDVLTGTPGDDGPGGSDAGTFLVHDPAFAGDCDADGIRNSQDTCTDHDFDGYGSAVFMPPSSCPTDCYDDSAAVRPGGLQLCDGFNNDCGDPSWPAVPAAECFAVLNLRASTQGSQVRLDWDLPAGGADAYRIYRGARSDLLAGRNGGLCFATTAGTSLVFTDDPASGQISFYLVAGVRGVVEGSRGEDWTGAEREHSNVCP